MEDFAKRFRGRLLVQLCDEEHSSTEGLPESDVKFGATFRNLLATLIEQVDHSSVDPMSDINNVIRKAYEQMSSPGCAASLYWRKLYTDACLSKAYLLISSSPRLPESIGRASIVTLDRAIIISGAPGDGSLELIWDMIKWIQLNVRWKNPVLATCDRVFTIAGEIVGRPLASTGNVMCIQPPSLVAFQKICSQSPLVLKGYVANWPAVDNWGRLQYLYSIAGPGRVVPVEIGDDYRSDEWTQNLLDWKDFICALDPQDSSHTHAGQVLYLAQHDLLKQFPALREDITVPDYVYASPGAPASYPTYRPPSNEDGLVVNVWFGPKGTISPAHTDPFYNCYAQVVGRKTVWLAPPEVSTCMYPYGPSLPGSDDGTIQHPATNTTEPLLSNTSRVDVFPASKEAAQASRYQYSAFWDAVPQKALSVTLEPGDLLFFPPGWWHAMRSEDISFSVSMWY
ncbi:hypothetical protein ID866_3366 [Astraeus odoratus]|nr:hypothetical protein ID866_3366 [Astraeus odoratus]